MEDNNHESLKGKKIIEHLRQNPPDAIVITSGSIVAVVTEIDGNNKRSARVIEGPERILDMDKIEPHTHGNRVASVRYTTTSFSRKDARGTAAAGKVRVIAATEITNSLRGIDPRYNPTIIALSRSTNNFSSQSDAAVAVGEYERREHGIKSEVIIDENPIDTFSELLILLRIGIERNFDQMVVLSTRFQAPRTQAMLRSLLGLNNPDDREQVEQMMRYNEWRIDNKIPDMPPGEKVRLKNAYKDAYSVILTSDHLPSVHVIASEDILAQGNQHLATIIHALEDDSDYQAQIEQDQRATLQWATRGEDGKMLYGRIPQ